MVEELDVAQYGAEPTLKRLYTWGLDLAGSFSGAGGIGGLLEIQNKATLLSGDTGTYLTVFDGNGNLTGLISTATKGLVAEYVPSPSGATPRSIASGTECEARAYDPFGSLLRETGRPIAFEQPFRFATKTYDRETELCNFGFRHYHTSLGRFINRDPIEERGGWALFKGLNYGMLNPFYGNRSLNATNFLAEYGSRQDEGLRNTSLAHSTETIGTGQPKNSSAKWERDLNTKFYSANANSTGHVGQGGSSGIEWHTPDMSVRSSDPWNRDANLYIYAGNDPVNFYDFLGLAVTATNLTLDQIKEAHGSGGTAVIIAAKFPMDPNGGKAIQGYANKFTGDPSKVANADSGKDIPAQAEKLAEKHSSTTLVAMVVHADSDGTMSRGANISPVMSQAAADMEKITGKQISDGSNKFKSAEATVILGCEIGASEMGIKEMQNTANDTGHPVYGPNVVAEVSNGVLTKENSSRQDIFIKVEPDIKEKGKEKENMRRGR
ncbi:MAG: RHS repeat-associated core domain-containing protein [Verrucomicrobiota bacterium]|nr:RHS repeat-associated core domain-containing protein [Verrucomicrobiota bacterium]